MLLAIAAVVLVLWLAGMIVIRTSRAMVHLLLIVVVILVATHFLSGG